MMSTIPTCVIVGANLAGASAAETLRREGYAGKITLLGAEPEWPYERPPLSKGFLRGEVTAQKLTLHDGQFYADQQIEVRLGARAVALDAAQRALTLADGTTLVGDHILIATGTEPRRLTCQGADLAGVHYLRTVADARAIAADLAPGRRLVVIGAGFIGAEVAASARQMGVEVTLLEVLPVPLQRVLGDEVGRVYADLHRAHGVDLRLSEGIASIEGTDRARAVLTTLGSRIPCDAVVVGIGVIPATGWLAGSGLDLANGVLTNEFCETSVAGILAAGDVANWWHPTWQERLRVEHYDNAIKQGAAAAMTIAGQRIPYAPVPYFWSDQYDVHLQYLGHATTWDDVVWRGNVAGCDGSVWYLQSGIPRAALLLNRPREMVPARKLIAAGQVLDRAQLADVTVEMRSLG